MMKRIGMMKNKLSTPYFSKPNAKLRKLEKLLGKKVYSFDLLAGWSCPYAKDCKSKVVGTIYGLRIQDSPSIKYRCFSASEEVVFPNTFLHRSNNLHFIKQYQKNPFVLAKLLGFALPKDIQVLRFHVAGDFFSQSYLKSIIILAKEHSNIDFYAYTKNIKGWLKCKKEIPDNLKFVASYGGIYDHLITDDLISAKVVKTEEEAKSLSLPIDDDDSHAYYNKENFCLLVHGIQPAKK